jgi:hypothetical protein
VFGGAARGKKGSNGGGDKMRLSLKGSEKGSFTSDQTLQTNGCCLMTMPHVTLSYLSQNF